MPRHSDEVEVLRLQGHINAAPVLAALRANGIPARMEGEALGTVYGLTLDGIGEVRILVPAEHADAARELLEAGELRVLELADGETVEDDLTGDGDRPAGEEDGTDR